MNRVSVQAEPHEFEFELERAALLVIDMQHDFCSPGGFLSSRGADVSRMRMPIAPLRRVLATCRAAGLTIIHTREGHRPDLADCPPSKLLKSRKAGRGIGDEGPLGRVLVRGSRSHAIIEELAPAPDEIVVDKPGKGAFFATDLDLILRTKAITHLIIGGVSTNVCVQSTAREAADRGYWNLVLEDCCAAALPELHRYSIEMIKYGGGIFGCVSTAEAFVGALAAAPVPGGVVRP
ncbi:MAG: cysteine hydrolase [Deltaproteobacteria bacterium]|nr:cysteine hydrolase [Deltaproteobacteria bacterium]